MGLSLSASDASTQTKESTDTSKAEPAFHAMSVTETRPVEKSAMTKYSVRNQGKEKTLSHSKNT